MTQLKTITRLPAPFIGKAPRPIQRKPRIKSAWRRLPFVATQPRRSTAPDWTVPPTGGYFGGYETGEAMAATFLKFLREHGTEFPAYPLTNIVASFMVRFEEEGGRAMDTRRPMSERTDSFESLRGQYVGFFNTLSCWLKVAAKHLGGNLDRITDEALVRKANAGLGFDQAAFMASLSNKEV
ncbi:MAG: hypothetical protein KIS91_02070 [Anaerolineae bacterium]|nr:hypothetical protein [Anaerolineae bacterium]